MSEPSRDTADEIVVASATIDEAQAPIRRELLERDLAELASKLGDDEVRVLLHLAKRLEGGQRTYGKLSLATDRRDFEQERADEISDMLVYSSIAELRRVHRGAR